MRVRVDEQLVRVVAQTFAGRIPIMSTVAVQLARADALEVSVPDVARLLGQRFARGLLADDLVEQTQLDARGVLVPAANTG